LPGDSQLLILGHRRARRLLAIPQSGVKNNQFIAHLNLLMVSEKLAE
jgi:hypothetical protein